jgi:membrane protease YdiL (CAAX protease family)
MWIAISLAAILFGVGHLGAAATVYELTPFVIARTIAGNALFGIVFGWLFWRRSLEAAMIAHATGHLTLTIIIALISVFAS